MRAALTEDKVRTFMGPGELWDTKLPGLVLRCRRGRRKTYEVRYGRSRRITIGRADVLTLAEARTLARQILGDVARGKDPVAERRRRRAGTLRGFIETQYLPWAAAHLVRGAEMARRVVRAFPELADQPLAHVTAFAVEKWKTARRQQGRRDTTIKRDLEALRGVLSKAVEWKILADHPLRGVRVPRVDPRARVRYLTPEEEARLREVLAGRDEARRAARARLNAWRAERGYPLLPPYPEPYTDHLTPIVLLAMNTGLRRGELLKLRWSDIDLALGLLTVRAEAAKTRYARRVPLNAEAREVLLAWRRCRPPATPDSLVFPGPNGEAMTTLKTAWGKVARAAGLRDFHFHDLRHHFASKLVMSGADLYAVGELLGHRTPVMTTRYAHLSPEHLRAVVEKLMAR